MRYLLKFNESKEPDMVLVQIFDILDEIDVKYEIKDGYVSKTSYIDQSKPSLVLSKLYKEILVTLPKASKLSDMGKIGQFCDRLVMLYDDEEVTIWSQSNHGEESIFMEVFVQMEEYEPSINIEPLKSILLDFIRVDDHPIAFISTDHPNLPPGERKKVIEFDYDNIDEYRKLLNKYFTNTDGYNWICNVDIGDDEFYLEAYWDIQREQLFFVCPTTADTAHVFKIMDDIRKKGGPYN